MYVGHDSMLSTVYADRDSLNLEDGSFELSEKATSEYVYVEAAWLIIMVHPERDQTNTNCFC